MPKKKKTRAKSAKSRPKSTGKLSKEVESLLLLVSGLLVLLALSARIAQGEDNLLGPYIGVMLSETLVRLSGPFPAFVVPFILFSLAWKRFREQKAPTSVRKIVFFSLLFVELCALLSINEIPLVPAPGMLLQGGGIIGSAIATWIFIPLFGRNAFGPYFVTLFGIIITAVWGARLRLSHFFDAMLFVKHIFDDLSEEFVKHWGSDQKATKPSKANRKKEKGRKEFAEDEEIREQEKDRLVDTRKRLEEKQEEFVKERTGVEPQIVDKMIEEDETLASEDETKESVAEKRQRLQSGMAVKQEEGAEITSPSDPKPEEYVDTSLSEPSTKSIPIIAGVSVKKKESRKFDAYAFPPLELLREPPPLGEVISKEELVENSRVLEEKLKDFAVEGKVINVYPGPIITRYEIELAPGIKVSKVQNLSDDLAMAMKAIRIRILAPIPGKAAIGIELPNDKSSVIYLREIIASEKFSAIKDGIPLAIAKTITGEPYIADLTKMPHLLVAGQTGSGKSVCVNCIISSIIYSKTPEECRLLMVDPKRVELALYNDIPHLFHPVVTESREAVKCLKWAVTEMENRYKILAKAGVRNISGFNDKFANGRIKEGVLSEEENQKMPYLVIIVDELADLMMTAANEVESNIVRLAQLARAVGIHLVIATQRPSTNVITGLIKANMPSRIAFQVSSKIDSRVILDYIGADKLLGRGDMLFIPPGVSELVRLHGAFVSDNETESVVDAVKTQNVKADRLEDWGIEDDALGLGEKDAGATGSNSSDTSLVVEAARLVVRHQLGSTSLIQRRLKVGYARAGRLMDELEEMGIVGANNGSKAREVLVDEAYLDDILAQKSQ